MSAIGRLQSPMLVEVNWQPLTQSGSSIIRLLPGSKLLEIRTDKTVLYLSNRTSLRWVRGAETIYRGATRFGLGGWAKRCSGRTLHAIS